MNEFVVAGLLITPLVEAALIALVLYIPVRWLLVRVRFHKAFWHPLLAEASIYVCLIAVVNALMP